MEPKDQKEKPLPLEACLLIYDEACRLCMSVKHDLERRGISQIRTGIRFVAYQSEAARTALGNDIVLVDLRQLSSSNLPERFCRGLMHFPLFFPICLAGR